MGDGITLTSGSIGATEADIRRVLERNGYEPDEPEASEPKAEAPEPVARSSQPTNDQLVAWNRHVRNYQVATQEFRKQVPDWETVVSDRVEIPGAAYQAILELEMPALAYHLGRHLEFTAKLAKMKPQEAYAEIYKLAERFRPPEGAVFKGPRGSTVLKSGGRTEPASKTRPAPKTAAAAAARGDYRAFKALYREERGW